MTDHGADNKQPQVEDIWSKYEQGLDYGRMSGRYDNAEKCWRFFEGDQWNGIKNSDGNLPFYNIIRPVIDYKKARVAMNSKTITFSVDDGDKNGVIEAINDQVKAAWKFGKMDSQCWKAVETAMVSGNAFLYFPDGRFFNQDEKLCRCNDRRKFVYVLEGCRVFLGDEEETELQNQPYIIVEERKLTEQLRREAKENGLSQREIDMIMPDKRSDAEVTTGLQEEQKVAGGYTTSILYLERTAEGIRFCRAVKNLIYQPFRTIEGMDYYPMAAYVVNRQKGKARGFGNVLHMIPNQIEINRTLVRRSVAVKKGAYPKLVYNRDFIQDISSLETEGASIELTDAQNINNVLEMVGYLQPTSISGDATNLENELISVTKELAGAGDAALGNINPEQASGAAITAVQDQADIPLNREVSAFTQLIEDIAIVWYHLIVAYNPIKYNGKKGTVNNQALKQYCPALEINVSSTIPDTVTARVNTLYNLLSAGYIDFDMFLELVGNDSNIPVEKLKGIMEERQQKEQGMMEMMAQQAKEERSGTELETMMNETAGENMFAGMMGG